MTATDVVVTVSEMLRAADLNAFDLSMWFRHPRAGEDGKKTPPFPVSRFLSSRHLGSLVPSSG